jgi:DNA-binding transcriptional regulator YdaS (Cro superfamily)
LKDPEATENRNVKISEVILSQNRVIKIAEELRPDIKWDTIKVASDEVLQAGLDAFKAEDSNPSSFMNVVLGTVFGHENYGSAYDENDNKLLGIRQLSEAELNQLIKSRLL